MSRALATVAAISSLEEHPDADRLEIATVRGWKCVVPKDEFSRLETVVFIEPDAFLYESEPKFAFLMQRGVKTAPDGVKGHVLKTVKLRGVISQGLVMKMEDWYDDLGGQMFAHGSDITHYLPLRLWEPPVPFSADTIGPFPDGILKTDEERVQNLDQSVLDSLMLHPRIFVREKVDGTSITAYSSSDGTAKILRVAGRNWELSPHSTAYRVVSQSDVVTWLMNYYDGKVYVQGELAGPGVQGNPLALSELTFFPFTIGIRGTDISLSPELWPTIMQQAAPPGVAITQKGNSITAKSLVEAVDGLSSIINPEKQMEGVVIRAYGLTGNQTLSFKVINPQYLLKSGGDS